MLTPRAISEACWVAECRRDIDGVMAWYHPDATYEGPDGFGSCPGNPARQ